MTVLETNSCPSGNKSMPILNEEQEQGGFRTLLEQCFMPLLKRRKLVKGGLAMVYDKNFMAASGYAAALADLAQEPVYLAPLAKGQEDPPVRFEQGVLQVRDKEGTWQPIRAAMRYVTQAPWSRIPVATKTVICNPVIACLAGGRNKLVASKAYEFFKSVLSVIAIDRMATQLISKSGGLKRRLFKSLNDDPRLLEEVMKAAPKTPPPPSASEG